MGQRYFLVAFLSLGAVLGFGVWAPAQGRKPHVPIVHVTVNMVQLDVAVTNKRGHYVTGLKPQDFAIYEDGIREKIAAFGEEDGTTIVLSRPGSGGKVPLVGGPSRGRLAVHRTISPGGPGASVFILFDTSNYMFKGFALARDAIAKFVRSLDPSDRVAFYSYSRDFFRACRLTSNREKVLRGVGATVAGDDAALYDALLWTLEDAGKYSGRRVVVVFSNGPDDASLVSPEDVRELAQSEGIPIYMISTRAAERDPLSTAVFRRISSSTGGKAYFARHWQDQEKAFASIRADLAHLYTLSYYPAPNSNFGWRKITVKLIGKKFRKDHIRTRSGYRPRPIGDTAETFPLPSSGASQTYSSN